MMPLSPHIKFSLIFFTLITVLVPLGSHAHESRPLYIEINEKVPGTYSVNVKTPTSIPGFNIPKPVLPASCAPQGEEIFMRDSGSWITRLEYNCPGGLTGKEIAVEYPAVNPSVSTLFNLNLLSGEKYSKLLSPNELTWLVPERESKLGVAKQYTLLGITHIWGGFDHLLFLICLLLVAGTWRRILITVTGFTIAHSVTLVLSALNLVNLPVAPVEAVIALSIVFLASEIAREPRDTLTYRYPVMVSVSFGLLHGFGFASVLKEIGLPQTEITTSLLFFNIGVEIGQIIFVLCIIAIFKIIISAIRVSDDVIPKLEKPAAYVVGSLAAFWMIERIYSFWY